MKTKPILSEKNKKERIVYAIKHLKDDFDWSKWINSDEKKFNLDGPDGFHSFWAFDDLPPEIFSKDYNVRKSVMVWWAIWSTRKSELKEVKKKSNSKDYQEILEDALLPCYENGDIFQQDGASIHQSKKTKSWLELKRIIIEPWPAKSPDMSPIENLWAWLAKKVYGNKPRYNTIEELKDAIWKAWDLIIE